MNITGKLTGAFLAVNALGYGVATAGANNHEVQNDYNSSYHETLHDTASSLPTAAQFVAGVGAVGYIIGAEMGKPKPPKP